MPATVWSSAPSRAPGKAWRFRPARRRRRNRPNSRSRPQDAGRAPQRGAIAPRDRGRGQGLAREIRVADRSRGRDLERPGRPDLRQVLRHHTKRGHWNRSGIRLPRPCLRPSRRDLDRGGDPAIRHRLVAVLRCLEPDAEHGHDVRVLPAHRYRRRRRRGRRREHRRGTGAGERRLGRGDLRGEGRCRPDHRRRAHDRAGVCAVSVRDGRELPDRPGLSLRRNLRSVYFAGGGVLHPAGAFVA